VANPHNPNYVERRGDRFALIWRDEIYGFYRSRKSASIALWRLKKVQKTMGAEPVPLSRLDRILQDADGQPLARVRACSGIRCPDCEGFLELRSGKFGLFYGCENYSKTLCRGSVSADRQGIPLGVPVNAATRRMRFLLRAALSWNGTPILLQSASTGNDTPIASNPQEFTELRLQLSSKIQGFSYEECRQALGELFEACPDLIEYVHNLPDHVQRTRHERVASETDPLDEMVGPIGVDHYHEG
jgi:ssDNA-binding Zn-finger/Zn-ribbon topoisomerase 1